MSDGHMSLGIPILFPWAEIHLQQHKSRWGLPISPFPGLLPGKLPESSFCLVVWLCRVWKHPWVETVSEGCSLWGRFHIQLLARAKGGAHVISLGMRVGWKWRSSAGVLPCDCLASTHPVSPYWCPGRPVTMHFGWSSWNIMFAGESYTEFDLSVGARVGCSLNCLSASLRMLQQWLVLWGWALFNFKKRPSEYFSQTCKGKFDISSWCNDFSRQQLFYWYPTKLVYR